MALLGVSDLPGVYAQASAAGVEVVNMQTYFADGGVQLPPAQFVNSKGPNGEDVENAQGFAFIADQAPSGKTNVKFQVKTLKPPFDQQVSDYIDAAQFADYAATGKPAGVLASASTPDTEADLTGTSTFNEATHTTQATRKPHAAKKVVVSTATATVTKTV